jgi:hypothetical protein
VPAIRRALTLATALAILCAFAPAAHADTVGDPNDVSGRFDVKGVTSLKHGTDAPITVSVRFWAGFDDTDLTKPNRVEIWFFCPGCTTPAYRGVIRYWAGPGELRMHLDDLGGSDVYPPIAVVRPRRNALSVTVKAGVAFNQPGVVRLYVKSYDGCGASCVDRAPDHGRLRSD